MAEEVSYPPGPMPGSLIMSNEQYHGTISRISKSGISEIGNTPAHFYAKYLDPKREKTKDPTPAQKTGTVTHCAILEPEELEKRFLVCPPCNRTTKEGKLIYGDFLMKLEEKRKEILLIEEVTQKDFDLARNCRDSVHKHPAAKELLDGVLTELSFWFTDPETGAQCRIRPDAINEQMALLVDVKTANDASRFGFGRDVASYEYDIQDPFYTDGMLQATGIKMRGFVFIAVEKEPPFAVGVYYLDARARESGRLKYKERLLTYQHCLTNNVWPAYSNEVERLFLPEWSIHKEFKALDVEI